MTARADPGSFRDPRAHVHHDGERVLRTVTPIAADDFERRARIERVETITTTGRRLCERTRH